MKTQSLFLIFFILGTISSHASPRLIIWHPQGTQFEVVVPALDGESPAQAVQNYVDSVNSTPEFRDGMMHGSTLQIPPSDFSEFSPRAPDVKFLVLANQLDQVDAGNFYMNLIVGLLREKQAAPYVLPVGADYRMNDDQRAEIKNLVGGTFEAELAVGGDDVDPSMYNEVNRYAHADELHPLRDQLESSFVKAYLKKGKGVLYAICRGHQLTGAIEGARITQDLYAEAWTETEHRGGTNHKITILPGSLMSRLTGGANEIVVNSLHHQAVQGAPEGWLASAQEQGPGGSRPVTEAMESKDGCAVTFQFHPEAMNDGIGGKIMWEMVQYARQMKAEGRR